MTLALVSFYRFGKRNKFHDSGNLQTLMYMRFSGLDLKIDQTWIKGDGKGREYIRGKGGAVGISSKGDGVVQGRGLYE